MVDYQTFQSSANPSPETQPAPPAASFVERLAGILDTAHRLYGDAEWLSIDAADPLSDLQKLVEHHPRGDDQREAALDAALDAASWVSNAADNVFGELGALIDHLHAATESLRTNTD